jgi:hypothetical protein
MTETLLRQLREYATRPGAKPLDELIRGYSAFRAVHPDRQPSVADCVVFGPLKDSVQGAVRDDPEIGGRRPQRPIRGLPEPNRESLASSRRLEQHLQADIHALRTKLFGSSEPPFPGRAAGAQWLASQRHNEGRVVAWEPAIREGGSGYFRIPKGSQLASFLDEYRGYVADRDLLDFLLTARRITIELPLVAVEPAFSPKACVRGGLIVPDGPGGAVAVMTLRCNARPSRRQWAQIHHAIFGSDPNRKYAPRLGGIAKPSRYERVLKLVAESPRSTRREQAADWSRQYPEDPLNEHQFNTLFSRARRRARPSRRATLA